MIRKEGDFPFLTLYFTPQYDILNMEGGEKDVL